MSAAHRLRTAGLGHGVRKNLTPGCRCTRPYSGGASRTHWRYQIELPCIPIPDQRRRAMLVFFILTQLSLSRVSSPLSSLPSYRPSIQTSKYGSMFLDVELLLET